MGAAADKEEDSLAKKMKPVDLVPGKQKKDVRRPHPAKIRVILIDDHALFRAGIRCILSEHFCIAGEANSVQAIKLVKQERPDVILLNIDNVKYGDDLGMIPDLLAASTPSKLAVLTHSRDPEIHRQAMLFGAIGIISTEDQPDHLINAIQRVHGGGVWIDRHVTAKMLANASMPSELSKDAKRIATLTERERELIKMVALGLRNPQIAERLFISSVTVQHHLTSIFSKLEISDRLELIVYAYRNRLAEIPSQQKDDES